MSDIPDNVISEAIRAVPATQTGVGSARMVRQIVTRAAPVIAAWARDQERAKWEARIERDLAAQRSIADSSSCESARQEATYCAGHLRSLLTEEEA